jgi:hypothetical protein
LLFMWEASGRWQRTQPLFAGHAAALEPEPTEDPDPRRLNY